MRKVVHFLLAFALSILTFPIVVFFAIIIAICYPCNPFLFQKRMGKNKRVFKIVKLRSLRNEDMMPIRFCGRFIRKCKIDELPQLWNVLLGQMAIVGPRATMVEWAESFNRKFESAGYSGRFNVLPGITGLAQVRGQAHDLPGNIQAVRSDLEFVEKISSGHWLGVDAQIFASTAIFILLQLPLVHSAKESFSNI